jgi:hypothetical protein
LRKEQSSSEEIVIEREVGREDKGEGHEGRGGGQSPGIVTQIANKEVWIRSCLLNSNI